MVIGDPVDLAGPRSGAPAAAVRMEDHPPPERQTPRRGGPAHAFGWPGRSKRTPATSIGQWAGFPASGHHGGHTKPIPLI